MSSSSEWDYMARDSQCKSFHQFSLFFIFSFKEFDWPSLSKNFFPHRTEGALSEEYCVNQPTDLTTVIILNIEPENKKKYVMVDRESRGLSILFVSALDYLGMSADFLFIFSFLVATMVTAVILTMLMTPFHLFKPSRQTNSHIRTLVRGRRKWVHTMILESRYIVANSSPFPKNTDHIGYS